MGCKRQDLLSRAEQLSNSLLPVLVGTIPESVCEGQMTFLKRTIGDTIYIGLANKVPTALDYNIILTDDIPSFTEDGILPGEIKFLATATTAKLSTYVSGRTG